jgi:hypothetical protein
MAPAEIDTLNQQGGRTMKHLTALLACLLMGVAMIGNAAAENGPGEITATGVVDYVAPETRSIIIDDQLFHYRSSVIIHTRHTNYGTIDQLKPNVSVRFRFQQNVTPVIEEIWVGEHVERKRFRNR